MLKIYLELSYNSFAFISASFRFFAAFVFRSLFSAFIPAFIFSPGGLACFGFLSVLLAG